MPTYTLPITTTEAVLIEQNDQRSALTLANPDSAAIFYISDEPGRGTSGIPIFPQSYIFWSLEELVDIRKKHYMISDTVTKTIHVREDFYKPPGQDNTKPVHDPPM